jgi:hypothetical protein
MLNYAGPNKKDLDRINKISWIYGIFILDPIDTSISSPRNFMPGFNPVNPVNPVSVNLLLGQLFSKNLIQYISTTKHTKGHEKRKDD